MIHRRKMGDFGFGEYWFADWKDFRSPDKLRELSGIVGRKAVLKIDWRGHAMNTILSRLRRRIRRSVFYAINHYDSVRTPCVCTIAVKKVKLSTTR